MKNFVTFTAPLVLSVLILGFLSVRNIKSYVEENARRVNSNILQQAQSTVDGLLDELNAITLNFSVNSRVQHGLRRILRNDQLTLDDVRELDIIRNILSVSHFSRPYIQSVYVYFDNPQGRFITSEDAYISLAEYPDTEWFDDYQQAPAQTESWWKLRELRRNEWSEDTIPVLTFYKLIYSGGTQGYGGVVVFNVYVKYLRDLLQELQSLEGQGTYILDKSRVLVASTDRWPVTAETVGDLSGELTEINIEHRPFTVSSVRSKYGLQYLSLVPNSALYSVADYALRLHLMFVAISLIAGTGLALYLARAANHQIRTITDIIQTAKDGEIRSLPTRGRRLDNSHQFILYNIINTFLEKDYLSVQLSEKAYKSRVDELTALQSQINPHFIFNTLQTINMKAMAHGPVTDDITSMIDHLSLILRYSLSDPGGLVRLEEEISHAKSYLAIQSVRYKDKIFTHWHFDEGMKDFCVIKLLFQPLIENSIYHGINERDGSGEIKIQIFTEADTLIVQIDDTGIGIPDGRLRDIRSKLSEPYDGAEHIGLINTNRRIKLTHGDTYGIDVDSEFGRGTRVTVRMPKILTNGVTRELPT